MQRRTYRSSQKLNPLYRSTYTVTILGIGQDILVSLESSASIADLKARVAPQLTNPGGLTYGLFQNGRALANESQSLASAGVQSDQPILLVFNMTTPTVSQRARAQQQRRTDPSTDEIENMRQDWQSNPEVRAQLRREWPELHDALDDASRFRDIWRAEQQRRKQAQEERNRILRELQADPDDPDNQRKIMEMIQQENIETQFQKDMEEHPECESSHASEYPLFRLD